MKSTVGYVLRRLAAAIVFFAAPFGWCAPHQYYTGGDWFCMRTHDAYRESDWMRIPPPVPFDQTRVRSVPEDAKAGEESKRGTAETINTVI